MSVSPQSYKNSTEGRLGSGKEDANLAESSYFAVRAALAGLKAEAARFITEHGCVGQGAPVMIRLASEITSRFGIVVSQKVAAQAASVIGRWAARL